MILWGGGGLELYIVKPSAEIHCGVKCICFMGIIVDKRKKKKKCVLSEVCDCAKVVKIILRK